MENVIFQYTLREAIADGVLYPVGVYGTKPLLVTAGTMEDVPAEEQRDIFDQFLRWQRDVEPGLPEEERMFVATASNQQSVWVIDDGMTITLLYPSEY